MVHDYQFPKPRKVQKGLGKFKATGNESTTKFVVEKVGNWNHYCSVFYFTDPSMMVKSSIFRGWMVNEASQ